MQPAILIVEDDTTTRVMLARWLEHSGYHVTEAPDGETAFDLLEKEAFDIIVTDIVLGTIDGIEVLYTARLQPYQPEVILLTGYGSLDTCIAAVRAGAYDYLQKPCDEEELLRRIEGAMQRRKTEQQRRIIEQRLVETATLVSDIYQQASAESHQQRVPLAATSPATNQPHYAETTDSTGYSFSAPYHIRELSIGKTRHDVFFKGQPIRLTPIEYTLLCYLAAKKGLVCRFSEMVYKTHGLNTTNADAQPLLKPHIHNLRKKLDSSYFINDRGIGYRLVNPDEEE